MNSVLAATITELGGLTTLVFVEGCRQLGGFG
jgi:hypothetical protein